jgi:hypothetical protein
MSRRTSGTAGRASVRRAGATPVEERLLEVDEPAEIELERRARPVEPHGLVGRMEVDAGLDEARLDPATSSACVPIGLMP